MYTKSETVSLVLVFMFLLLILKNGGVI
jgi:hypothetical protein